MSEVVVRLPRPERYLTPNCVTGSDAAGVWKVLLMHIGAKKRARKLAAVAAAAVCCPEGWRPLEYVLVWYYYGQKSDADNCLSSCKAYLDGCAAAWGCNDRDWECAGVRRVRDKELCGCVELRFRDTLTQVDYEQEFFVLV